MCLTLVGRAAGIIQKKKKKKKSTKKNKKKIKQKEVKDFNENVYKISIQLLPFVMDVP